jgi:hypothetical protein
LTVSPFFLKVRMSKCQAKKYLAGGRCGGGSGPCVKEDSSGLSASFSAYLAARSQQDSQLWSQANSLPASTQLVVVPKKEESQQKNADIDLILNGDF